MSSHANFRGGGGGGGGGKCPAGIHVCSTPADTDLYLKENIMQWNMKYEVQMKTHENKHFRNGIKFPTNST